MLLSRKRRKSGGEKSARLADRQGRTDVLEAGRQPRGGVASLREAAFAAAGASDGGRCMLHSGDRCRATDHRRMRRRGDGPVAERSTATRSNADSALPMPTP